MCTKNTPTNIPYPIMNVTFIRQESRVSSIKKGVDPAFGAAVPQFLRLVTMKQNNNSYHLEFFHAKRKVDPPAYFNFEIEILLPVL